MPTHAEDPVPIELVESRRRPGRVDVRAGRRTVGTLTPASVAALGLRPGERLTQELVSRIERRMELERAYRIAMDALARRGRTRHEIEEMLRRRGVAPAVIGDTIAALEQEGTLKDDEIARRIVQETLARAGAGRALLESKLAAKGIDAETSKGVIDDELASGGAVEAARRRLGAIPAHLEPGVRARRLFAFLARRGFDEHESAEAVRAVLGVDADGDGD